MNRKIVALLPALLISAAAVFANGTDEAGAAPVYPERDIQFVVPFPVGGSTGTPAQILAHYLDDYFTAVDVVIGDITGAGGSVGARHVLNSRPDGYTLLLAVPGVCAPAGVACAISVGCGLEFFASLVTSLR